MFVSVCNKNCNDDNSIVMVLQYYIAILSDQVHRVLWGATIVLALELLRGHDVRNIDAVLLSDYHSTQNR